MTNYILSLRLDGVATWPFDTAMLGRFAAIIVSVTVVILSKYVQIALHL